MIPVVRLLVLALLGPALLASAPRGPDARIRERIEAVVTTGRAPAIAVAVGRGDRVRWSMAFGMADTSRGVPATPRTPFSIASVTKPFTATALMILDERGLVSLDEPLSRYLGPLRRPGVRSDVEVTARRTLGHVAGFPPHHRFFFADELSRPLPFRERMRCFGAEVEAPGARVVYSNLGYGVLGELVARVSGQSYGAFLASEVFAPIGLAHASVPEREDQLEGGATRYGDNGAPLPFYTTDHEGASAVYASVEDLVRFGLFHAGTLTPARPVITAGSRAAMQQPGLANRGLGWSIVPDWGGRLGVWHGGAMPGSSAILWIVPDEGIAVAVVANQLGAPVQQLAGEILADALDIPLPVAANPPVGDEAPARQAGNDAGTSVRGQWRGTLSSCPQPTSFELEIRSDDRLTIAVDDARAEAVNSLRVTEGRVRGVFAAGSERGPSRFELDLRVRRNRLEGPVIRSTRLGPRGSTRVTLWASLARVTARGASRPPVVDVPTDQE